MAKMFAELAATDVPFRAFFFADALTASVSISARGSNFGRTKYFFGYGRRIFVECGSNTSERAFLK